MTCQDFCNLENLLKIADFFENKLSRTIFNLFLSSVPYIMIVFFSVVISWTAAVLLIRNGSIFPMTAILWTFSNFRSLSPSLNGLFLKDLTKSFHKNRQGCLLLINTGPIPVLFLAIQRSFTCRRHVYKRRTYKQFRNS